MADSPLKIANNFKRQTIKKRFFDDTYPAKLRPKQPLVIPKSTKKVPEIEFELEKKFHEKIKTSVDILNAHCQKVLPKLSFITQPTRSPDLNVLDLGIWNSLQSIVPFVKYEENAIIKMSDRIAMEVARAWNEYESLEKLSKIFNTLKMIYSEVIDVSGSNNYKLPRSKSQS